MPSATASTQFPNSTNEEVIGQRGTYTKIGPISSGGYGAVYRVRRDLDGQYYALKWEKRELHRDHFKLTMEKEVLEAAARRQRTQHFPELIDSCTQRDHKWMWIVMTLLGESLANIKRVQNGMRFSPNTGYHCALQTLEAIQQLHELGYIHRDIKPANFVIGCRGAINFNSVYMVDFGIARRFLNDAGSVKTPRKDLRFKGTVRHASLAAHMGEEQGRKDDIESWLYMLSELMNARLPWHNIDDRKEVERMKRRACDSPSLLFTDNQMELREIMTYVRKRHYVEQLDYRFIRHMVVRAALRERAVRQPPFDWQNRRD